MPLPRPLGIDRHWRVAGLTLSAGLAGWVEFALLRRALQARIGTVLVSGARIAKLWVCAFVAAGCGFGLKRVLPFHQPVLVGLCVLSVFGVVYVAATATLGVAAPGRLARFLGR